MQIAPFPVVYPPKIPPLPEAKSHSSVKRGNHGTPEKGQWVPRAAEDERWLSGVSALKLSIPDKKAPDSVQYDTVGARRGARGREGLQRTPGVWYSVCGAADRSFDEVLPIVASLQRKSPTLLLLIVGFVQMDFHK